MDDRRGHERAQEARREPAPVPADQTARLLALQRSAGNAAVARMIIARQDEKSEDIGYSDPAATGGYEADSSSEEEAETLDPTAQLTTAVATRMEEKGTANEVAYTESSSESEATELSEDEPDDVKDIDMYSDPAEAKAAEDDSMSEVSEDEPADDAIVAYTEAGETEAEEEKSTGRPVSGASLELPALPETAYAEIPAKRKKRKGRLKRAVEAIAKPVKAVGAALKKLGSRLKRKKKGAKLTPVDLAYTTEEKDALPDAKSVLKYSRSKTSTVEEQKDGYADDGYSDKFTQILAEAKDDEESFSEDVPMKPIKYGDIASMRMDKSEQFDSADFLNDTLLAANQLVGDMKRHELAGQDENPKAVMADKRRVREALMKVWGWSDEDVKKHYDFKSNKAKNTKVDYITSAEDLKKFTVQPGASLTYGDPPQAFDTAGMVSKAGGPGYAIFVMDARGNIFAGQHRVGLFHHSSFLAGEAVAAAGEMKVEGGKLVELTAKSGHYWPTAEHTLQVVRELAAAGVNMAGVRIKVWDTTSPKTETQVFDGADFLANGASATVLETKGKFE